MISDKVRHQKKSCSGVSTETSVCWDQSVGQKIQPINWKTKQHVSLWGKTNKPPYISCMWTLFNRFILQQQTWCTRLLGVQSSACGVWNNVKHEGDQSETFIVSQQLPVETQWSVWSEVVLTGGWKTNGEVAETEKKKHSAWTFQGVDELQQLVQILSKWIRTWWKKLSLMNLSFLDSVGGGFLCYHFHFLSVVSQLCTTHWFS